MMCEAGSDTIASICSDCLTDRVPCLFTCVDIPDRVHAATIAGVAPTYLKMPLHHSEGAARAMDLCFSV